MGGLVSVSCCESNAWVAESEKGHKTLVLVHGLASCALQSKVDPTVDIGCSLPFSDAVGWDLTFASIEEVLTGPERFRNTLELRNVTKYRPDGTSVLSTKNLDGVQVRPYPGLKGIATLNPGELLEVPIWKRCLQQLAPTYRLRAANYDWRRWGDVMFMEGYVEEFRQLVEDEARRTGFLVGVLAHSLGATVACYCVSVLGCDWTRCFISELFLVGPVLMGSPKQCSAFAHNPASTATGAKLPPLVEDFFRQCMITSPAMPSMLPMRVSGVACFPEDHKFVKTPTRSYTIDEMDEYVNDLQRLLPPGRVPTAEFWPSICREANKITAPPVPTHIVYGNKVDTPFQVKFDDANCQRTPAVSMWAPGDGTITAASCLNLAQAWRRQGASVTAHLVGESDDNEHEHLAMIQTAWFPQLLENLLCARMAKFHPSHPSIISARLPT